MAPWDDVLVELKVGEDWVDLVGLGLVRATAPITIRRGRDDEMENVQYGTCSLVLDNADGRFSPRNPNSAWYGLIGRNTPIRVYAIPHLTSGPGMDDTDAFGRTVSSGWGTTSGGGNAYTSWYAGGTYSSTQTSVSSGTGWHTVPSDLAWRGNVLHGLSVEDVDVYATCTQTVTDVTGAALEPGGIILRAAGDLGSLLLCRLSVSTAEVMTAQIRAITPAGDTLLASAAVSGFSWSGQALRYRARCLGVTVQYKVWPASSSEPDAWSVEADDTTVLASGGVGFRSGVESGNTNVKPSVFSWDDISITPLAVRFYGEIPEWPVRWNTRGTNVYTTVQASGILRRLNQGNRNPRSPLSRRCLQLYTLAYWALTDGPLAVLGADAGTRSAGLSVDTGTIKFSQVDGPSGDPGKLPQLVWDSDIITAAIRSPISPPSDYQYTIDVSFLLEPLATADTWEAVILGWLDHSGNFWDILHFGDRTAGTFDLALSGFHSIYQDVTMPDVGATISANVADGLWHHLRCEIYVSGGLTYAVMTLDGDTESFGSGTLETLGLVEMTLYNHKNIDFQSVSVGHIVLYNGVGGIDSTYDAFLGHPGDTISGRLGRLEEQDGVPLVLRDSSTSLSQALTVQRSAGLVDLLHDVQAADLGVLTEMRNSNAVRYRTVSTLYNQIPTQLSYADGHIASSPDTTDDDQHVWNDVTVQRYNGSQTRATLSSGILSTQAPPDGVGTYDRDVFTSHVDVSESLDDVAGWLLHIGTWDDSRWPAIPVELATPGVAADQALVWEILSLDVGDVVGITDLPAWLPPDDVAGIVQGYTEVIGPKTWHITYTTTPAGVYDVGVYDSLEGRYGATAATLSASCTSTATSLGVTTTGPRFVRSADDSESMPFDILVGGERMTVTSVTGTTSPQTFTVTRSINGIVKAHSSGEEVRLFRGVHYAM